MSSDKMDPSDRQALVEECTRASEEGRTTFPEVVAKLTQAGVERYHADLLRAEKTYYWRDDSSLVVAATPVKHAFARDFSASEVEQAVRASQAGRIRYVEFCERVAAAGCVGYFVSLVGRRVVYYGRTGESHIELFPASR
ncbi:MAG TPA: DUF1398 family protein [Polyangiaceae bacterium]|nr:DUF1398 family protein [Polyangiaceae bacterium]